MMKEEAGVAEDVAAGGQRPFLDEFTFSSGISHS